MRTGSTAKTSSSGGGDGNSSSKSKTTTNPPPAAQTEDPSSKPVYFYRPHGPNGFLSQWYPSPMSTSGTGTGTDITFTCAEQYMMYHKAQHFGDSATAAAVLATSDPLAHKRLGRAVRPFDAAAWDEVKYGVVVAGTLLKFGGGGGLQQAGEEGEQREKLREQLLATGHRELVEASPRDRVWGIGFGASGADRAGRERWGQNLLGKALMEVRERLRE